MERAFQTIGQFTPDNLISGNRIPLFTQSIELAKGTGTLTRGTIITVNGALAKGTTTEGLVTLDEVEGILTDDVELSNTSTTHATVYITGEFNSEHMTVGANATVWDFKRELRKLGIFIK